MVWFGGGRFFRFFCLFFIFSLKLFKFTCRGVCLFGVFFVFGVFFEKERERISLQLQNCHNDIYTDMGSYQVLF